MQEIILKNVKTAQYTDVNLNKTYDPDTIHEKSFAFKRCNITSPQESGEGKLSVRFYILSPGKSNYPYHQHTGIEEVFYIISGTATLKTVVYLDIDTVSLPEAVLYPDTGKIRIFTGNLQKSFKLDTEVNYLHGE